MTEILVRDIILGFSAFVVGMCIYMDLRALHALVTERKLWQVWFLMIYAGIAIIVALISELVAAAPGVPLNWRVALYILGLGLIFFGMVGVAWSVGHQNKRRTDDGERRRSS